MFKLKRYSLAISFILSVFSTTFLAASAASRYWIKAVIHNTEALDGRPVIGSLHYGLYEGKITLKSPETRRYQLYISCLVDWCVVTCKTTSTARLEYITNISNGFHSQSDECDDNAQEDRTRPLLTEPQTMNNILFYAINVALYFQLLFVGLSALTAVISALFLESKLVQGLHSLMGYNFASIILGLTILILWGHLYSNTLRHHLAFPYLEAHNLEISTTIGHSYWLVFLAVISSIGSMAMAFIRAEYLRRDMLETLI